MKQARLPQGRRTKTFQHLCCIGEIARPTASITLRKSRFSIRPSALEAGRRYPELNDIVGVTITDFELWPASKGYNVPMLSRWRMQEQSSGTIGLFFRFNLIGDLCEVLSIPLTPERASALEKLDHAALEALRERLKRTKEWA